MREIPVLLYHNVGDYPPEMMEDGITAQAFARQMRYLSTHGYRIVTIDEAVDHLAGIRRLPDRSLAITIDGGYRDAILNVAHVLRQYQFPAVFFIAPEFIGGERAIKGNPIRCLTWPQVRELNESGFTIGLLANGGVGIKSPHDVDVVKGRIAAAMENLHANLNAGIRYCAFKEGVPGADLWAFIVSGIVPSRRGSRALTSGPLYNPGGSAPSSPSARQTSAPHLPGSAGSRSTMTITISFLLKYQRPTCFSKISAPGNTSAGTSWTACFTVCRNG